MAYLLGNRGNVLFVLEPHSAKALSGKRKYVIIPGEAAEAWSGPICAKFDRKQIGTGIKIAREGGEHSPGTTNRILPLVVVLRRKKQKNKNYYVLLPWTVVWYT